MSRWKDMPAAGQNSGLSSLLSWVSCGGEAAAPFLGSGVCWCKQARLWARSLAGGRGHTGLQKTALRCSRSDIALSHSKPWRGNHVCGLFTGGFEY